MQLVEELNTATMTVPFNTKEDETERHDDDAGACADAGVYTPEMSGNVPVEVTSRMMGLVSDKSFEVAAAMLVNAACAAVGVVNFVTVTVMMPAAGKVPVFSLMVNTELANATEHVGDPEEGAVTAQAESEATAMPDPDSVMRIPAFVDPAVMALVGVNEIVAVVCVAFMTDDRYTARF